MISHPDEQARELAREFLAKLHPSARDAFEYDCDGVLQDLLAALLTRVRQQALEEAAQACEADNTSAFMEANIRRAFADRIRSLAKRAAAAQPGDKADRGER